MADANYVHVVPNSDFKYLSKVGVVRDDEHEDYSVRLQPVLGDEIRVILSKQQMRELMVSVLQQDALSGLDTTVTGEAHE